MLGQHMHETFLGVCIICVNKLQIVACCKAIPSLLLMTLAISQHQLDSNRITIDFNKSEVVQPLLNNIYNFASYV